MSEKIYRIWWVEAPPWGKPSYYIDKEINGECYHLLDEGFHTNTWVKVDILEIRTQFTHTFVEVLECLSDGRSPAILELFLKLEV